MSGKVLRGVNPPVLLLLCLRVNPLFRFCGPAAEKMRVNLLPVFGPAAAVCFQVNLR